MTMSLLLLLLSTNVCCGNEFFESNIIDLFRHEQSFLWTQVTHLPSSLENDNNTRCVHTENNMASDHSKENELSDGSCSKQPKNDAIEATEVKLELFVEDDYEKWWGKEPVRKMSIPLALYKADNGDRLLDIYSRHYEIQKFSVRSVVNELHRVLRKSSITDRLMSRPFICEKKEIAIGASYSYKVQQCLPYRFTVLGDSHTSTFEMASLRVNNMNATTVYQSSMYGLKNSNSTSGARKKFASVIKENQRFDSGRDRNVIVFYLGDNDVHGLSWRKYLSNETEGILRSFAVFGKFVREQVIEPGGYAHMLLVTVPPPIVQNQSFGGKEAVRPYNLATLQQRIEAKNAFNTALRLFCAQLSEIYKNSKGNNNSFSRSFQCNVVDITPKVWNDEARLVHRPYVNLLRPDIHLRPDRVFGLMLEQVRLSLPNAAWGFIENDGRNNIKSNINEVSLHGQNSLSIHGDSVLNQVIERGNFLLKTFEEVKNRDVIGDNCRSSSTGCSSNKLDSRYVGFEPVVFDVECFVDNQPFLFTINAVHYLSPLAIANKVVFEGQLVNTYHENGLKVIFEIFKHPAQFDALVGAISKFLGSSWGEEGGNSL